MLGGAICDQWMSGERSGCEVTGLTPAMMHGFDCCLIMRTVVTTSAHVHIKVSRHTRVQASQPSADRTAIVPARKRERESYHSHLSALIAHLGPAHRSKVRDHENVQDCKKPMSCIDTIAAQLGGFKRLH